MLLRRGAREGSRAPLGSAPGCHLIYFYRNEMFLSEARVARNGVSVTPEAPAALGSARSSSWVWGRATPLGEATQSACSLIRPFVHSAIHSFIHSSFPQPKSIECRALCEKPGLGGQQHGLGPSPPASSPVGHSARRPSEGAAGRGSSRRGGDQPQAGDWAERMSSCPQEPGFDGRRLRRAKRELEPSDGVRWVWRLSWIPGGLP